MSDFFKKVKDHLLYVIKGDPDENIPQKPNEPEIISVLMQDGTIEKYPENFRITDGINCAVCNGIVYHTHLDCQYLKNERIISKVKGMYIKDAESKGIYKCFNCKELDDLYSEDD